MKSNDLCTTMGRELASWRQRLLDITSKIDRMPSIEKYRLTPHIEGLHILVAELDDRINLLHDDCLASLEGDERAADTLLAQPVFHFKEDRGVCHDYDFGG